MSYKKWIYKYKYLLAEQDEIEEKFSEYASEFNKIWANKNQPEDLEIKEKSNIDWDVELEEDIDQEGEPKKEPKKGRDLYKKISKEVHPDKGGNEEDFKEISELYSEENILGMYLKAEELGVELEESDLEDIEETFDKSCAIISEKNLIRHQTLAWIWANCPPEKKEALIEKIKKTYNLEYRK
jgi:hypothetical protein|tara:strand:- start:125 stop:673 length:549 start_codon:yes stop_codon:yes gene_type:complete